MNQTSPFRSMRPVIAFLLIIIIFVLSIMVIDRIKQKFEIKAQPIRAKAVNQISEPQIIEFEPEKKSSFIGVESERVRFVFYQYNRYTKYRAWSKATNSCYEKHWQDFQKAGQLTDYDPAVLAGKALIESKCQFVNSTNGDGGIGPMQITHPSKKHIKRVGEILDIETSRVNYRQNYLHNVILGAVMLQDFETLFQSREVGMLAYNRGPANVKRDMRKAGLKNFSQVFLEEFRLFVPEKAGKGGRPRVYVDCILAGMVMMHRASQNLPIKPLQALSLNDIPASNSFEDLSK